MYSYLFWLLSTFALATPADIRARQLYQNGVLLYDEGSYEQALLAFQEAYNFSNRHALLYNMSKTLSKMERYEEALEALKKYRIYAPLKKQKQLQAEGAEIEAKWEIQKKKNEKEEKERKNNEEQQRQIALKKEREAERKKQMEAQLQKQHTKAQAQYNNIQTSLRYGGATVGLIGGGIAISSFVVSQSQIDNFDKKGYEGLQPFNHVGIAIAIIGSSAAIGSFFLVKPEPAKQAEAPKP